MSSSPVNQRGQNFQSLIGCQDNRDMKTIENQMLCNIQTPEAYCHQINDQRISHDQFLKTLEHLPKLKNELLRESNPSLCFIRNNMDLKNAYLNH